MPSAFEAAQAYLKEQGTKKPADKTVTPSSATSSKAIQAAQAYLDSKKPKPKEDPKKKEEPKKEEPSYTPPANMPPNPALSMPIPFGSTGSTQMIPSQAQQDTANAIIKPVVNTTKVVAQTVAAKAKEMRQSNDTGTRLIGALGDSAISIVKDFGKKLDTATKKPTPAALVDYVLTGVTAGIFDFIPNAAPEIAGAAAENFVQKSPLGGIINPKAVRNLTQKGVEKGMEFIFGKVLNEGVGGLGVKGYEAAFGEQDPETQAQIRSIASIGTMLFGFHAVGKVSGIRDVRLDEARDAAGMVKPMGEALGVEVKLDKQGRPIVPSDKVINQAYKESLNKAADEGGVHVNAKMDAFDTSKQMLTDYKNMSPAKFNAKWQPVFEQGSRLADRMVERVDTKMEDAGIEQSAQKVNDVITKPATKETLRDARNLSEREQLAFEQEVVDMNAENDPKLAKQAEASGYSYERTDDPFDRRPANYDTQSGKITLNEAVIRDTLKEVWNDKVIRIGEGRLTTVFRKLKNESFEAMKKRYEDTLIKHEISHAKTVTPEDAARLRAAIDSGDKKLEATLRADLEEKANRYTVENGNTLSESDNIQIDRAAKDYQSYADTREQMNLQKYEGTELETAYQRWKKLAKNNPDYANAHFDELEKGLSKRAAYKQPGAVKALFEDALAKGDGVGATTFDELLDQFKKRAKTEDKILSGYKETRAAQKKLDLKDSPKDAQTREFIRKEVKAEAERQLLNSKNRKLEMDVLRQRIGRRLERRVMDERFKDLEARLKGQKVNANEKLDTTKRTADMRVLKENIKGRARKEALRGRMEGQKEAIRGRIVTKAEAQQAIVDFMRENRVPKDVRIQSISSLKNAKNPADVAKVLEEMRRNWNEYDRKQTVKDIKNIFKDNSPEINRSGLKEGKMTADAQRELNRIEEVSGMKRNELNQEIVKLVDEFRSKNPDTIELPEEIADRMKILELGGLKEQTLQQLEATKDYIENLVETGRTERQAQVEAEKAKSQTVVDSARTHLNGTKAEVNRTGIKQNEGLISRAKESAKAFWRSGSLLDEAVSKLGSDVENLAHESVSRSNRAEAEATSSIKKMTDFMQKTYGDEAGLLNQEMAKQTDLGTFENANGGETKFVLTKGQALDLYMKLQDAKARQSILEDNGFTPEMVDKALGLLTPKDKAMGEYIIENGYAPFHEGLAKAYEYTRGVPYGKVDRYSGHLRYEGDPEASPFLDQILMDVSNRRRIGSPEFVKSRQEGVHRNLVLSSNPFADFERYAAKASHYTSMAETAPRWNALLNDKTVRESLIEKHGKSAWDTFEYHVKNQLRGGIEDTKISKMNALTNKITGNVSGVLVRRPEVVAGQFSSLAQFRSVAKRGSAFWRGVRNAGEMKETLYKYAPGIRVRAEGGGAKILQDAMGRKSALGRGIGKFSDLTGKPLSMADDFTTLRGSAGLFNDRVEFYQKNGNMSLEDARVKAGQDVENFIVTTQSTSNIAGKSQIELEPSNLQGFTNLRNQPNKVIHGNKVAYERFKSGKISGKEYATYLYWNNVVQPVAYVTLRYGAKAARLGLAAAALSAVGQKGAAEDQLKKLSVSNYGKEVLASIINTGATGTFLVGDMAEMVTNAAIFGKPYEVRPGVLQSVLADSYNAILQMQSGDVDEASLLTIRGITRAIGLPDPMDAMGIFLSVLSRGNTEAKAEARKTPEAKKEVKAKRKATAQQKKSQ